MVQFVCGQQTWTYCWKCVLSKKYKRKVCFLFNQLKIWYLRLWKVHSQLFCAWFSIKGTKAITDPFCWRFCLLPCKKSEPRLWNAFFFVGDFPQPITNYTIYHNRTWPEKKSLHEQHKLVERHLAQEMS